MNKLNAYTPAYTFVHGAGARDMSNVQGFQLLVSGMNVYVYAETHSEVRHRAKCVRREVYGRGGV